MYNITFAPSVSSTHSAQILTFFSALLKHYVVKQNPSLTYLYRITQLLVVALPASGFIPVHKTYKLAIFRPKSHL